MHLVMRPSCDAVKNVKNWSVFIFRLFNFRKKISDRDICQYMVAKDHPVYIDKVYNEPVHEKTNNLGFRPGPTLISLNSRRIARILKFRMKEEEGLYYPCSKNKGVINFTVTAKLVCVFGFCIHRLFVCLCSGSNGVWF